VRASKEEKSASMQFQTRVKKYKQDERSKKSVEKEKVRKRKATHKFGWQKKVCKFVQPKTAR